MAANYSKPLPALSQGDIIRFWNKIDKSPGQGPTGECWRWTAAFRGPNKYGAFWLAGHQVNACRVALFLYSGKDPFPLNACHTCDWTPCCNGVHLFPGTYADNSADMVRKGHSMLGERQPLAKLTEDRVRELREAYGPPRGRYAQKDGRISQLELAIRFGIDRHTLRDIIQRKIWSHVQ